MIIKLHWLHFWRLFFLVVVFALATISLSKYLHTKYVSWGSRVVVVPTLSSLVASQVVNMTACDAAGGVVAARCFPVSKLSPGNTLHVLSQNTWQSITKCMWSIWSYSSITIDGGGSSIWRLGCRWWPAGLSLWQLMMPPMTLEQSDWRPSIFGDCMRSRYIMI